MDIAVRHDVYFHLDEAIDAKLDRVLSQLSQLEAKMDAALDALSQQVAATTTVQESAVALLNGLGVEILKVEQELADMGITSQALTNLKINLQSSTDLLANAVAANTVASSTAANTGAGTTPVAP